MAILNSIWNQIKSNKDSYVWAKRSDIPSWMNTTWNMTTIIHILALISWITLMIISSSKAFAIISTFSILGVLVIILIVQVFLIWKGYQIACNGEGPLLPFKEENE